MIRSAHTSIWTTRRYLSQGTVSCNLPASSNDVPQSNMVSGKFLGVAFKIPKKLENAVFYPALVLKVKLLMRTC